jgi:transcription elongation GreA/GreB family factor
MQIPIRKPGQYTNSKPDPHLTEDKFNELQSALEKLKKFSRPRAADEVDRLSKLGDFSENADYSIAKGRLRGINQRILELEDHLKQAVIIKPAKNTGTVQLGHAVIVEVNGARKTYRILGSEEINPSRGIISHQSPIGAGLMGRKVGDIVKIKIADRKAEYKIIEIQS